MRPRNAMHGIPSFTLTISQCPESVANMFDEVGSRTAVNIIRVIELISSEEKGSNNMTISHSKSII